ncbi:adenosylcobinamide-GDP ribazoletransferase [bacterium]|nr:adenosylcobinamide-GDP ribazoletransferase [bacterium]
MRARDALRAPAIALGMFSRLPVPAAAWDERGMRTAICWWPLVGVVQAALTAGWGALAAALWLPAPLAALGFVAVPPLVTGGLHVDGMADTVDALASHADRERRLAVMADPHVGSFAALAVAGYVVASFALFQCVSLGWRVPLATGMAYVASRATAALTVTRWPSAHPGGLADTFGRPARGRGQAAALAAQAVSALVVAGFAAGPAVALAELAGLVASLVVYRRMATRALGGVTGDTTGWYIQVSELVMVAATVLVGVLG